MNEYIKREDLIKFANVIKTKYCNNNHMLDMDGLLYLAEQIPAADVYPVVHGRWKQGAYHFYCSECFVDCRDKVPYCPNCGARMDGEF